MLKGSEQNTHWGSSGYFNAYRKPHNYHAVQNIIKKLPVKIKALEIKSMKKENMNTNSLVHKKESQTNYRRKKLYEERR